MSNKPYGKIEVEISMDEYENLSQLAEKFDKPIETIFRIALHNLAVDEDIEDGPWLEE